MAIIAAPDIALATDEPVLLEPVPDRYVIRTRLDASSHRLFTVQEISFTNTSNAPLHELYFHLYLNAFRSEKSAFSRSSAEKGMLYGQPHIPGYIDIESLRVQGSELWPTAEYTKADDKTDVRVPLPRELAPDEGITVSLRWSAQLPSLTHRTGFAGDYHFAGQWFPKLAKLNKDGTWEHFPFFSLAEFYSDFANYDVTLDLPEAMVVGATGEESSRTQEAKRQILRFVAKQVHDFAWVAWPEFQLSEFVVDGTKVKLLMPPGHAANQKTTSKAVSSALPFFNSRFGSYPYSTLTIVHPPKEAAQSGGMEYPTLITTGGSWYTPYFSEDTALVTVHELAHQWFYGVLASDEAHWPFLDEGLTSYAESLFMDQYSRGVVQWFGHDISAAALQRIPHTAYRTEPDAPIIGQPAREFKTLQALADGAYKRSATVVRTLAGVFGQHGVSNALFSYAQKFRFLHPTPNDLLAELQAHVGKDGAHQAEAAFFKRARIDVAITKFNCRPHGSSFLTSIELERGGALKLPLLVELTDSRGVHSRVSWAMDTPSTTLYHRSEAPIVSVLADPDLLIPLDENLLNNGKTQRSVPPTRSATQLNFFAALLSDWLGPL